MIPETTVESQQVRPNVLFILADDLRPQLGVYGRRAQTPNLDRLAEESITFERAYAQVKYFFILIFDFELWIKN